MNKHKLHTIFISTLWLLNSIIPYVFADELDETVKEKQQKEQQAQQTQQQLFQAKQYEGTLASQLSQMSNDLYLARSEYANAVAKLNAKQQEISDNEVNIQTREKEVEYQTSLIAARIRDLYKNSQYSPLTYLFLSDDFNKINTEYVYRMNIIREDKKTISDLKDRIDILNRERAALERDKAQMDQDKIDLENQKVQLEAQEAYLNSQIASARETQNQLAGQLSGLNSEIASLSVKEQQILAEKAAAAADSTSVGPEEENDGSISEVTPSKASGDFYSFWSYGFPHRVGMNQYGAYGRALSGQNADQILKAYYSGVSLETVNTNNTQIKVQGYDKQGRYVNESMSFEDKYLLGIAEMPSSWPLEAQKAQAIAARTYAMKNTGNLSLSICADENCQVYNQDKVFSGDATLWHQAVRETKGLVLKSGGDYISAWYASTAGGATLSAEEVWGGYRSYATGIVDTDSAGKAYDGPSWGNSPWYHKSWGDDPWLSKEEVADMVNAALLPEEYNGNLPAAPNGFTENEVKAKLTELNLKVVEDIKSIELSVGLQQTETFRVFYKDTYVNLDPQRFRFVFNLRSPGTDALWSSRFDVQSN